MGKSVIKLNNLPAKLPVTETMVYVMAMDFFKTPQWGIGIMAFLLCCKWIIAIYDLCTQQSVDIFKSAKDK